MPADQSNLFSSGSNLYLTGLEGELFDEIDFSTDMTSVTITAAGTTVIMKGDGSTPKATLRNTVYGSIASGWSIVCNSSNASPIQIKDVLATVGHSYTAPMCVLDPVWSKEPNWNTDRWFLEVIYNGISAPADHTVHWDGGRMGVVASGSSATWASLYPVEGFRTFVYLKQKSDGSEYEGGFWGTDQGGASPDWGSPTNNMLSETTPISSSMRYLFDSFQARGALKLGATDYTSGSLLPNGDWNFDTVGKRAVTVSRTPATDYTNGPAIVFYFGTERDSSDKVSFGIKKIRLYVAVPNSRTPAQ